MVKEEPGKVRIFARGKGRKVRHRLWAFAKTKVGAKRDQKIGGGRILPLPKSSPLYKQGFRYGVYTAE